MKVRVLAAAVLGIVLALSMGMMAFPNASGGALAKPTPQPKWLELLYLDADNSLDVNAGAHHTPVVQADLDELTSVGSTTDVQVYVLVDRVAGPAHLYKVLKGSLQEQTAFSLNGLEVNMGDPATLRAFVSYTVAKANPLQTLLIFWDHGSPEYCAWDDHTSDAGGSDMLTHQEAIQALQGYHVDVIATDECLVGQIEVAQEYISKGMSCDYLIASETYTGWRGFPYDWTLRDLVANPAMTPRAVAVMMVTETQNLLSQNPYQGEEVTSHSAFDLSKVQALSSSIMNLANILKEDMRTNAAIISKSKGAAQFSYGANAMNLMDLRVWVQKVSDNSADPIVKNACSAVLANFDQVVVALQVTQTLDHQINGLGICLPNHPSEMPAYYLNFAFPLMGWYDFMQEYWAAAGNT